MAQHPNDLTTDEEIDAALERAKAFDGFPTIIEADYISEAKVNCLMLRLSNGQRMLIPVEMLSELKNATPEQAADLTIAELGFRSGGHSWTTASTCRIFCNTAGAKSGRGSQPEADPSALVILSSEAA